MNIQHDKDKLMYKKKITFFLQKVDNLDLCTGL